MNLINLNDYIMTFLQSAAFIDKGDAMVTFLFLRTLFSIKYKKLLRKNTNYIHHSVQSYNV